jgi:hypothetical protein
VEQEVKLVTHLEEVVERQLWEEHILHLLLAVMVYQVQ